MTSPKPASHVSPVTKGPRGTDAAKVDLTRNHTTSAKNSPDWAAAPDVQTAFIAWNKVADALDANGTSITSLRKQLSDAESSQHTLRIQWVACARGVLTAVALFTGGAAKLIVSLGFGTRSHNALGPLLAVEGLTAALGKLAGETLITWLRGDAQHGFLVQHATDPANQATWAVPVPCTKVRLLLDGLPPGSVVHVRVCAIDPSVKGGQAPWSPWIAATVR